MTHLIQRCFYLEPIAHSKAVYILWGDFERCTGKHAANTRTMYALLNAQMLGIYSETEPSLWTQRTGDIKPNWNGLRWKLPRCFPARMDSPCYWECLEKNPPRLLCSQLHSSVCLQIFRTIFTVNDYVSQGSLWGGGRVLKRRQTRLKLDSLQHLPPRHFDLVMALPTVSIHPKGERGCRYRTSQKSIQ